MAHNYRKLFRPLDAATYLTHYPRTRILRTFDLPLPMNILLFQISFCLLRWI
jgi:hypothetical protein